MCSILSLCPGSEFKRRRGLLRSLFLTLFFSNIFQCGLYGQHDGIILRHRSDSSVWIRVTAAVQAWARYTDHNPGSAIALGGTTYRDPSPFDIGIRRARFQAFGNVAPRVFLYTQFGLNNFSYLSQRKAGAFFHDLVAEYSIVPRAISAGAGLTGWSGLSRYASPSIATTLMYDAPLFQQATNDVNEQFLRKLSMYLKGKISRLDYRAAISKPMPVQLAAPSVDTSLADIAFQSGFSPSLPRLQCQAYVNWQFLDEENNLTPYTTGTWAGVRNVLNVGAGIIYQPDAMRHQNLSGEIFHTPMRLLAADIFFDHVLDKIKRTAITAYAGFFDYDFGPNHIRTLGVMNPANAGINKNVSVYSGAGNAYAMFGTGNILHGQVGYKFRDSMFGNAGTLQPYADIVYAKYQAFSGAMITWNGGINWLMSRYGSRISLNYQERPVFVRNPATLKGEPLNAARRAMVVLQYQVAI